MTGVADANCNSAKTVFTEGEIALHLTRLLNAY